VEYHHCSSDGNSLDGVALPDQGIALLDGTAPHRVVSTQETVGVCNLGYIGKTRRGAAGTSFDSPSECRISGACVECGRG